MRFSALIHAGMCLATAGAGITCVEGSTPNLPATYRDFDAPPHLYSQRTPTDRFTKLKGALEDGTLPVDRSSEKAFVLSVLKALDIPVSSQLWVFSTTSLQLSLISPSNPRALYFNEDVYVGYVPGGRIEIVALDPELGGIFYIFDVPRENRPIRIERSDRCMNCHAGEETGHIPGLTAKSVVPGPSGGSLTAYRIDITGHEIPFDQRFGGWHVTGRHGISNHWGNLTGRFRDGSLTTLSNAPGQRFDVGRYPAPTSDILAHLLHEHQVGFVNRVVEAGYRARTALHASGGKLNAAQANELDEQAALVTRYLLFAGEAPLPAPGVEGDASYQEAFLRNRRPGPGGASLKDLELNTRLFKHRCSYMIYSPVFEGLPRAMKERIYARLNAALSDGQHTLEEFAYLPAAEKRQIRGILKSTLTDLPPSW